MQTMTLDELREYNRRPDIARLIAAAGGPRLDESLTDEVARLKREGKWEAFKRCVKPRLKR